VWTWTELKFIRIGSRVQDQLLTERLMGIRACLKGNSFVSFPVRNFWGEGGSLLGTLQFPLSSSVHSGKWRASNFRWPQIPPVFSNFAIDSVIKQSKTVFPSHIKSLKIKIYKTVIFQIYYIWV